MSFLTLPTPQPRVDVAAIEALVNGAMREIALAAGSSVSDPLYALVAAEHSFQASGLPEPADEESFWRAVVRLGALIGEALRAPAAGAWVYSPDALGTCP